MGFGSILKTAFPFISAAAGLGGPLGTMAANAVGQALGVEKVDPSPDGITAAITAAQSKDPDALLKLQDAENQFKLQMQKLGLDDAEKMAQMDVDDRANARARQIAVKDRTPAILAFTTTAGFFALLALLAYHAVPVQSEKLLDVMLGSLGTAWIGVMNYFFGSSSGSAAKTQIMAQQAQTTK